MSSASESNPDDSKPIGSKRYLDLAARVAWRGFGLVEPNPMVGAVIVRDGEVIGIGHHTRFGALHAEREAIANCKSRGHDPRGATLYCTLEPCSHFGKQPPCTLAVIEAGIAKVVIARRDPARVSAGGIAELRDAGVEVEVCESSVRATRLSDPFIHRIETGRPWVIAKWAQTLDGRIATSIGESQWISGSACRARVHRLRAKVDGIMVGVGTAIADDPMLTARDCLSTRRLAKRIVLDTHGRLNHQSKLVMTADEIPTIVCTANPDAFAGTACEVVETPIQDGKTDGHLDLCAALGALADGYDLTTILVEAGPRVLGALVEEDLIDEAVVHLAPAVMGDERSRAVAIGRDAPRLSDMRRYQLIRSKQLGDDIELH
ncbi:MAG: bifunctional diaminohydroxyphosphoribosylaminopyrimidine deaminase/5-amino-6-(5-phosphoribosylamino)uracil reductase RibD, partial [Phycisphaerales bacterium]